MNKNIALFTLVVTLATGCNKQETYTVDYLLANDDIRATVLTDCAANKQSQENCAAANEAEGRKKAKELEERMTGGR